MLEALSPEARDSFRRKVDREIQKRPITDLTMPYTAPDYPEIASRFLICQENGVSVFNGGPLELCTYGIGEAWVLPTEVRDSDGHTNFHVLYLNCSPQHPEGAKLEISYARTVDLKTGNINDPETQRLQEYIKTGDNAPRIILRPSLVGSLYYPQLSTQLSMPSPGQVVKRMERLSGVLGLDFDRRSVDKAGIARMVKPFEFWAEYPLFFLGMPEKIVAEAGPVYMYPIISPGDPWQYYQLFINQPLERVNKQATTTLRTDSGCDNGQLYLDLGCECRSQLLTSLAAIQQPVHADDGGIVIHIPTQDGRGYGMNSKLDTEGMKRGISMIYNRNDDPPEAMDTIAAAERVFGSNYDIRTFDGVARILQQLGFKTIRLLTDNVEKTNALLDAGLAVQRVKTGTKGNGVNDRHLEAKKHSKRYFPD